MKRTQRMIFVNTSGWLALYNPNDSHHAAARDLWEDLRNQAVRLITTDYVLDQVYTTLKVFGSLQAAEALHTVLTSTSLLRMFLVDSVIFERAWKVFIEDDHPQFTFTDCINYAVIQYLAVSEVFTFDRNFTAPGLISLPSVGE